MGRRKDSSHERRVITHGGRPMVRRNDKVPMYLHEHKAQHAKGKWLDKLVFLIREFFCGAHICLFKMKDVSVEQKELCITTSKQLGRILA
jgi:hypothetical protein